MTKEVKNVPDLRFPGFENTWEKKKLFDILKSKGEGIKRGPFGGALKKEIFKNSGFAIYEQKNAIYDNQHFRYFIDEEKYNEMIGFAVKQGDIIMSCSGTIGKLSLIPEDAKIGIINQALIRFRTNNTILNTYFLIYMRSQYMQKKILESNPGSAITNLIPVKELKLLNFPLPNINEQQKIGEFFSKLDRQIELEEQKLEKLEEQKKGYMQKVFSQELRFKDANGNEYPEWEDKKLLNVIAIQNGYAFKSNLFSEKGMPIIRITDINKSTVKKGTVYYPESIEINERFKIKQYDILIAMSGATTGKVGKYISEKPSLLNQRIGKFVMKKGTDNNFMFTYLNSLYFKKELSKLLVAGAQPNISSQDIENINLFIPINEEQRKIGEFFNELDELIEKQSSKIGVLKQRKKGFLQKMFV